MLILSLLYVTIVFMLFLYYVYIHINFWGKLVENANFRIYLLK